MFLQCLALLLSAAATPPEAAAGPGVVHEVPTTLAYGRHLIPVSVNGAAPSTFLLDAGIQQAVIDPDTCEGLVSDEVEGPPSPDVILDFANMTPFPTTVALTSLAGLSDSLGTPIHGLLPLYQPGYEVTIQWQSPSVAWRSLEDARLPTEEKAQPMQLDVSGAIRLELKLNGVEPVVCTLDLSYDGFLFLQPEAIPGDLLATSQMRIGHPDGSIDAYLRFDACSVGDYVVADPVVAIAGYGAPNLVGLEFLASGKLTLNFESGLVLIEASGGSQVRRKPVEGYGIQPVWEGSGYFLSVVEHGPGADAGLLPGDQILAVNGEDILLAGPDDLARLFNAPQGSRMTIVAQRNGDIQEFYLESRVLF